MSGRFRAIQIGEHPGDPFVDKPGQPKRHGNPLGLPSALENNGENPTGKIDRRHVADERNAAFQVTHTTPFRSYTERFGSVGESPGADNRLICVNRIYCVPFLPTAPKLRPTAEVA